MDEGKKANIVIGIGVTTTPNRKHLLDEWLINFRKHTKEPYHLHIHEDTYYRGVAYSKNENLNALKDCDYIFLFDDDCYPIQDEWLNFFINSGESHLLYMCNKLHGDYKPEIKALNSKKNNYFDTTNNSIVIKHYSNCGGVFMMLTKEIVEKVGFFNPEYGRYGFEHAGYSQRIFRACFTNSPYQMLKDTDKYLRALDYECKIQSSVSDEVKQKEIEKNRKIFIQELNSNNIYCKFAD